MSKLQNFDIGIEPIFKINGIFILFKRIPMEKNMNELAYKPRTTRKANQ